MSLLRGLLTKLQEFLLPERSRNGAAGYTEPIDVLLAVYQRMSRLAAQIESHAELAPYPHVAERLHQIAREEHEIANRLKRIVGTLHGSIRERSLPPATGKNHWQRLIRDLEDQRDVDNILAQYEFTLIPQIPDTADLLHQIKSTHSLHRLSLQELIAVADPQASQT
jgi:rubrerythrin